MAAEIWKAVKGFEGLYEVSNLGRVKSLERITQSSSKNGNVYERKTHGRTLKQYVDRYGYMKVILTKEGKPYYFTVHRLVAIAFVENPHSKKCVDHIDCNRTNNHSDNLRWVTVDENLQHSHNLGRQKWNAKPVIATSPSGKKYVFVSQREAGRNTGLNQSSIGRCANGQTNSVKGWYFEYGSNESVC